MYKMFLENDIKVISDIQKYDGIIVEKDFLVKTRYQLIRSDFFQLLLIKKLSIEKIIAVDDLKKLVDEDNNRVYSDEQAKASKSKSTQGFIICLSHLESSEILFVNHNILGESTTRVLKKSSAEAISVEFEIKEYGIENVVARNSVDSDYVHICKIADVESGRALNNKGSVLERSSAPKNRFIGARHLNMFPVITNDLYLPETTTVSTKNSDIKEGTVLVNSDSHIVEEFCRPSYVFETPKLPTFLSTKIFAIKLKDEYRDDLEYSKELFHFFLDNITIRKQLLFPVESGRIVISIKSFRNLFVPKKGVYSSSAIDFENLKELTNRKSSLLVEKAFVDASIDSVMSKYNNREEDSNLLSSKEIRKLKEKMISISSLVN